MRIFRDVWVFVVSRHLPKTNMADLLWSGGGEFLAVVCNNGVKVLDGR